MAVAKISLAICLVVAFFSKSEARQVCGIEIEYRGFDPEEALRLIQERQIIEFNRFQSLINQLKFKAQSEDFLAWKRCLSEYVKEKAQFLEASLRIKSNYHNLVQSLVSRNLDAAQKQIELQKLLVQFQTEYTPTVDQFKNNIKNLFDTIQDENRRKKWWSTVKTTQVTTNGGVTTRTSITKNSFGQGATQLGSSISKSSQSYSNGIQGGIVGGYQGSAQKVVKKSSAVVASSQYGNTGNYGGEDIRNYNGKSNNNYGSQSGNNYDSQSSNNYDSQSSNNYGSQSSNNNGGQYVSSSQNQETNYSSNEGSNESQVRSGSGGYAVKSEVEKSASYASEKKVSGGSLSDSSGINFAQTRSGLKDTYGGAYSESPAAGGYTQKSGAGGYSQTSAVKKETYAASSSSGGYRKRRTLGLVAGILGKKSSEGYNSYGNSRGVGVDVNVGAGGAATRSAGVSVSVGSSGVRSGHQSQVGTYESSVTGVRGGSTGYSSNELGYQSNSLGNSIGNSFDGYQQGLQHSAGSQIQQTAQYSHESGYLGGGSGAFKSATKNVETSATSVGGSYY